MVSSSLVKLETSNTVIIPPTVSVLCIIYRLGLSLLSLVRRFYVSSDRLNSYFDRKIFLWMTIFLRNGHPDLYGSGRVITNKCAPMPDLCLLNWHLYK